MAHTDIHRPCWVLYQDPSMRRHFREFHHHPHGTCDIDVFLDWFLRGDGLMRTTCRVYWTSAQRICACERCAQRAEHRREVRRERRQARLDIRNERWDRLAKIT